jgi:predicted RND superfamily exporter protein
VDTYTVQFLFEDNPVYRDHLEIESSFGNYMPMEFLVETHTTDGAKRPEVLRFVSQLAERVEGVENVSKVLALPAVVKRLNQAFHVGEEGSYAIPDSLQVVSQELLFYDPDRADDPQRLVDRPYYRTCRLTARVKNLSARGWEKILDDVTAAVAVLEPPPGVVVRPSGYLPMYVKQADYVVESLVESFAIAFVVVFFLIGVFTRSLRLALISVVPNCLPIAMVLGGMGLCGIRLDVATVVIAAVALGMVVDDTVHFLFRFKREMQSNGGDHAAAVEMAMRTTGVALVGTSVTLCTGFVVFVGAGIKSIVFFGLLTGVTMLAALAGDLLLLPALLVLLRPKLR